MPSDPRKLKLKFGWTNCSPTTFASFEYVPDFQRHSKTERGDETMKQYNLSEQDGLRNIDQSYDWTAHIAP
jgi:hypothetical protein